MTRQRHYRRILTHRASLGFNPYETALIHAQAWHIATMWDRKDKLSEAQANRALFNSRPKLQAG